MPAPRPHLRSRGEQAKEMTRMHILQAARALYAESRLVPTVSAIAKRAQIAKGTVFLYFPSKEDLILAVVEDLYHNVFEQIAASRETDPVLFARVVLRAIEDDPEFLSLASFVHAKLEQDLDADRILRHKAFLTNGLRVIAESFGRVFPKMSDERLHFLILSSFAFVTGLWQQCCQPPSVARLAMHCDVSPLLLDFDDAVIKGLKAYWDGLSF